MASGTLRADPVDDLQQALKVPLSESSEPSDVFLKFRKEELKLRVAALKTLGDLRRALILDDWQDLPHIQFPKKRPLNRIDADARKKVGDRFIDAVRDVVKDEDKNVTSRLAVATLIAELEPTIRATTLDKNGFPDGTSFTRGLTPEVIRLTRDKDAGVRQQALRALGTIFPNPKVAVPVLQEALEKDSLMSRRVAAAGLAQMVRVANFLQKPGKSQGVRAIREEVLDTILEVLKAIPGSLDDADPVVQAGCLQAIQGSAQGLADIFELTYVPLNEDLTKAGFSPSVRRKDLAPKDREMIEAYQAEVAGVLKSVREPIGALQKQRTKLIHGLVHPDTAVKLAALEALENIGYARLKLKRLVLRVPEIEIKETLGGKENAKLDDKGNRAQLKDMDTLEVFIAKNLDTITLLLTNSEPRIRRGAIDFLEIIEEAALPALGQLVERLEDPDRFVRWSAARTIGNIAGLVEDKEKPKLADAAVPKLAGLFLKKYADDYYEDLNVRLAAAQTLEVLGPTASKAIPALAQAVLMGDVEGRVGVMDALMAIGPDREFTGLAVASLVKVMAHEDPRVRRSAARALGNYGPIAGTREAIQILRRALGDEDQDVRINASDALLSMLRRNEK